MGLHFLEISGRFLWHREVYGKKVKIGTSSGVVVKSSGFRNPWKVNIALVGVQEKWNLAFSKNLLLIWFHLGTETPWDFYFSKWVIIFPSNQISYG